MTPARQPNPERCEMCESFRWIPPAKPTGYCEWCMADVDPNWKCGCVPSHYSEATHSSTPAPEPDWDLYSKEQMNQAWDEGAKAERERVLDDEIIPWIKQYCFKPAFGESVVPKKSLCKFLESLREQEEQG